MKSISLLLIVGLACFAFRAAGQEKTGSIDGTVVDEQGQPVPGAWVSFGRREPEQVRPIGGRLPGTPTDEKGQFAIHSLDLGQYWVAACKENADVPCPPFFYPTRQEQFTLTPQFPSVTLKVRLGEKVGVITGIVKDANTGKPLNAFFTLKQLQFPDRLMSMSSPPAFRIFVIPLTDYNLQVSVPEYADWSYSAQPNLSQPLRLGPGAHLDLDVQLSPIAPAGYALSTGKFSALYDRLVQPSETNAAAPEILEMAKGDSAARDFFAEKLPSVIVDRLPPPDSRNVSPVWLNTVRLVGQLKMAEAVPALTQALSRPEMCGGYDIKYSCGGMTFSSMARLDLDVAGRALADIGDPSVPSLADILSKGDFPARRRAMWILININSPSAKKAMSDHLPNESNPIIKGMIEHQLGIW